MVISMKYYFAHLVVISFSLLQVGTNCLELPAEDTAVNAAKERVSTCPDNCSGHGSCKRPIIRGANDTLNGGRGEGGLRNGVDFQQNSLHTGPLKCECYQGWSGEACELELNKLSTCPKRCSDGRGDCVNGVCHCFHPYAGEDCGVDLCPNFCSGHGKCVDTGCRCFGDFTGEDCSVPTCAALSQCNGHGKCNSKGQCDCDKGFTGEDCNLGGCPDDCSGHGVCGYGMLCKCDVGWSGENCRSQACASGCVHGVCSSDGICVCEKGYRGENCEMKDCEEPCGVHGSCDAFGGCKCDVGWEDSTCTTPVCPYNCSSHGICSDEHLCECDEGFEAPFCMHKACVVDENGHVCNQHGVCNAGECLCEPGWYGPSCERHECPSIEDKNGVVRNCSGHGHCPNNGNGRCKCDEGYAGDACDEIICPENCHKNGYCTPRASGKGVHCTCKKGWKGLTCNIPECPNNCNGNGYCLFGSCYCYGNFTGPECNVTFCPNQCSQHGVCENVTTKPVCSCEKGWGDPDCNRITCPGEETEHGACHGHGKCGKDKYLADYGNCTCSRGWKGIGCNIPACPRDCNNRGKCVFGECICEIGWKGSTCDKMDCKNMCSGHGVCEVSNVSLSVSSISPIHVLNASLNHGVYCKCDDGWGGIEGDCGSNISCAENCNGNGDCLDGKCYCKDGWYGEACNEKTCPNLCSGHGICTSNHTCLCQDEYTGESCDIRQCPNNCTSDKNGVCFNFTCICRSDYFGVDCSKKRCPKDCSKRGKCIHGQCSCHIGFGGEACEKKLCPGITDQCNGHGKCDEEIGKCVCTLPWEGRLCNVSNCYNNGIWNVSTSKCACKSGYTGVMCEFKFCPSHPLSKVECSGNGICNITTGICECTAGFTGSNCAAPFALLPRLNDTWKDGIRRGGNETIDSSAKAIDALESAQLLKNTSVYDANENRLQTLGLNISSRNRSLIDQTGVKGSPSRRLEDFVNKKLMAEQGIDIIPSQLESVPSTKQKGSRKFTNVDYTNKYDARLSDPNGFIRAQGTILRRKPDDNERDRNAESAFRFKESLHSELIAEAISEINSKNDGAFNNNPSGNRKMLRSQ